MECYHEQAASDKTYDNDRKRKEFLEKTKKRVDKSEKKWYSVEAVFESSQWK